MASSIFSIAWVKGAGERAIKSFVQGGITGLLGSGVVNVANVAGKVPDILALPWYAALSAGLTMALLSVATSVLQPDFTAGTPTNTDPPAELDDTEGGLVDDNEPEGILDDEDPLPDDEQPVEAGLGNESTPEHAAQ